MKLKITLLLFLSLSISSVFAVDNTYGDITYEKAVNLSGKQRMLSQRLCLFFVAKKFDLKNKNTSYRTNEILNKTYNELDASLIDLLNSELNSLDVEEAIGNALLSFENLRSQSEKFLSGKASLNIVYNTTNKLTKDFDYLTSKYSALKAKNNNALSNR